MTRRLVTTSTLASLVALGSAGLAAPAHAAGDPPSKEKCYGIAGAGQNDCADLTNTHSCAGQSTVARSPLDWKYVPAGTCRTLGGLDEAAAKAKSNVK